MIKLFFSSSRTAYELLDLALQEYGLSARPEIARTETGKPYFPTRPDLHFNVSHSGTLALCALGDAPVGVDVERIRPRGAGLPAYALTTAEQLEYTALGGRWEDFYTLWTRREAWCKYTGLGVARSRGRDIPPALSLRSFEGADWRAAVCVAGQIEGLKENLPGFLIFS